ncbi:MAG: PDZ domain-containing protein [Acidobacteriota bacterium]|nr:PDZ domain-containing protein [Acidobacteriota bacterium]
MSRRIHRTVFLWLALGAVFATFRLDAQEAEMFLFLKGGSGSLAVDRVGLPVSIKGSHTMIVLARLNGKDKLHPFIFDTGGVTLLDQAIARDYGLEVTDMGAETAITNLDRIDFSGVTVTDFRPFVMDFSSRFGTGAGEGKEQAPAGMVGCDLLRFFRITIDYRHDHIRLERGTNPLTSEAENCDLLPMQIRLPYHPCIDVTLWDSLRLPGLIDTGLHYAMVLPLARIRDLPEREKQRLIKSRGVFARWPWTDTDENYLYAVPEVRIGRFVFKDQPVLFAELPPQMGDDVMLLGRYFLEGFATTLDFRTRKVRLEQIPRQRRRSPAFSAGVHLVRQGKAVKIKAIWQGSPADRAGLKPGQEISAVNGRPAAEWGNGALTDMLLDCDIPRVSLILEKDGKKRSLTLKKVDLFAKTSGPFKS